MSDLGVPAYFATVLGIWKLLGVIAIVIPRLPRLKEWAYAGFFFDLSGAAFSHAYSGHSFAIIAQPVIFLAFVIASWALRPSNRKLAGNLL